MATAKSGSVTAGGTSQTLMAAAGQPRQGWAVQNLSGETLHVNDTGAAASGSDGLSYAIAPGQMLSTTAHDSVAQGLITIIGATTGSKFLAREW